jgi:hypothetical protein
MNFKIVAVLLAFVAVSQAYFVLNTWADENCNTTLIARYFTSDPTPCQRKRAIAQDSGQCEVDNIGVYYSTDLSYCESATEPEFPAGWQSVRFGEDSTCNYTTADASYSFIGAQSLENIPIAVFYLHVGYIPINATMSCADSGVLYLATCLEGSPCLEYSLATDACVGDAASNSTFATQTSCVAAPVSPVAAPIAAPVAAPTSAPVRAPITTPATSNAASVVVFGGCAVVLSLIIAFI